MAVGTGLVGKRKKKGKFNGERFVPVFIDMMKSEAWQFITNASRVAYLHLKAKKVTHEQAEVTLSFKEMEPFMNRNTYSRSIDELAVVGFITKVQTGGLFRRRNHYQFTEAWRTFKKEKVTMKINSSIETDTVSSIETDTVGKVRSRLTVSKPIPVEAL